MEDSNFRIVKKTLRSGVIIFCVEKRTSYSGWQSEGEFISFDSAKTRYHELTRNEVVSTEIINVL